MVKDLFDKFSDDEFLKFDRIENKLHQRPDICAFLLLDKLVPGETDIVSAGEHDVIYLDVDLDDLENIATENDILTLVRCGVLYFEEYDCLGMFV